MTLVVKTIRDTRWYYFQDSINVNGKSKVISTCIGKASLEDQELLEVKEKAWTKHLVSIYKEKELITETPYKFREKISCDKDEIEAIGLLYRTMKKNLTENELYEFRNTFFIKHVYGTTTVEGNTLTEEQTNKLLTAGLTSSNKTLSETLEVANYNDFNNELGEYKGKITESVIRKIHLLLMKGVKNHSGKLVDAGNYRKIQAVISNVWHKPAPPKEIPRFMMYLLSDYNESVKENIHPIELASNFHQRFEEIHPFEEGNGRTGREILNIMLRRNGYPEIYVTPQQHSKYLDALEQGNIGESSPLIEFIIERMNATLVFMASKTSYWNFLSSSEYRDLMTEQTGTPEIYEKWIAICKKYRDSNQIP